MTLENVSIRGLSGDFIRNADNTLATFWLITNNTRIHGNGYHFFSLPTGALIDLSLNNSDFVNFNLIYSHTGGQTSSDSYITNTNFISKKFRC